MVRKSFSGWSIVLVMACLAALGGCKKSDSSSSASTSGKKRIILLNNNDSEFWSAARGGIKEANEKLHLADAGIVALMEVNNGTVEGQIQKLQQFAAQPDVVGVGLSVFDPDNPRLIEQMRKLQEKGIPVLCFDSDVNRSKYRDARSYFVGTDNIEGGRLLGDVAKHLKPEGAPTRSSSAASRPKTPKSG